MDQLNKNPVKVDIQIESLASLEKQAFYSTCFIFDVVSMGCEPRNIIVTDGISNDGGSFRLTYDIIAPQHGIEEERTHGLVDIPMGTHYDTIFGYFLDSILSFYDFIIVQPSSSSGEAHFNATLTTEGQKTLVGGNGTVDQDRIELIFKPNGLSDDFYPLIFPNNPTNYPLVSCGKQFFEGGV